MQFSCFFFLGLLGQNSEFLWLTVRLLHTKTWTYFTTGISCENYSNYWNNCEFFSSLLTNIVNYIMKWMEFYMWLIVCMLQNRIWKVTNMAILTMKGCSFDWRWTKYLCQYSFAAHQRQEMSLVLIKRKLIRHLKILHLNRKK